MGGLSPKKDLQYVEKVAERRKGDTLRLWESYRDQAHFWRALTLLQIPVSLLCLTIALVLYFTRITVLDVPEKPQPGHYSVEKLPDSDFIGVATEVVNLISSYQPATAPQQFSTARKFLWEPALSVFEDKMIKGDLDAIRETQRSQMFFIDPGQIKVERRPEYQKVIVHLPGTRQKLIGEKMLPADKLIYHATMTTIPRNVHNPYGIVIIGLELEKVEEFAPQS